MLSYLIIGFSMIGIGISCIFVFQRITRPIENDILPLMQNVSDKSQKNDLAQQIKYYDEVLTQAARNYAFTQNKKWEQIYTTAAPQLDAIIQEATAVVDEQDKASFATINSSNSALVDMETKALQLTGQGNAQGAVQILESAEYWNQKAMYKSGLDQYVARSLLETKNSISSSFDSLRALVLSTKNLVNQFVVSLIFFSLGAFAFSVLVGFIFSLFFLKRFKEIKKVTDEMAEGKTNRYIQVKNNDELSDIAKSINIMAEKITETHNALEEKIRTRTKQLQDSEEEIKKVLADSERALKLMVGRELEMLTLKKEIIALKKKK